MLVRDPYQSVPFVQPECSQVNHCTSRACHTLSATEFSKVELVHSLRRVNGKSVPQNMYVQHSSDLEIKSPPVEGQSQAPKDSKECMHLVAHMKFWRVALEESMIICCSMHKLAISSSTASSYRSSELEKLYIARRWPTAAPASSFWRLTGQMVRSFEHWRQPHQAGMIGHLFRPTPPTPGSIRRTDHQDILREGVKVLGNSTISTLNPMCNRQCCRAAQGPTNVLSVGWKNGWELYRIWNHRLRTKCLSMCCAAICGFAECSC